jgi:hypothetical protein
VAGVDGKCAWSGVAAVRVGRGRVGDSEHAGVLLRGWSLAIAWLRCGAGWTVLSWARFFLNVMRGRAARVGRRARGRQKISPPPRPAAG